MSDSTFVAYPKIRPTQIVNRHNFQAPPEYSSNEENVQRNRSAKEFMEYLKNREPKTYGTLAHFAEEYPPKQLTEKERKKINTTMLKSFRAPNPRTVKNIWQKLETWLLNKTKRPPRTTLEDIKEKYDTYVNKN